MRLSGVEGSVRGFSSGEALLIGGRVYFGWLNSGETVLTEVEPRLPGCPPVKSFSPEDNLFNCLTDSAAERSFKAAIHNLRATQ